MSELSITTTQNVNINFTAAHAGARMGASWIDIFIKGAYTGIVTYILMSVAGLDNYMSSLDQWEVATVYLGINIPVIFYSLVFESIFEGQTPGKKLLKLKVIKIDGYQASFGDYLIRWLMRLVDINLTGGIIALIFVSNSKKHQRLGDMAAGTAVINLKNDISINHTILREVQSNYVPIYPLVIKLSDNDVRIIKETYEASMRTTDFPMIERLQMRIENVTGIKSTSANAMAFVNTVLHDYNYYTQNM
ncbi:RDD family protein [Flavobacterium sp. DG1-102-2]|uniref:RDD family protein n=1 Tax=Flavobacterium sp. DG1-102-2 TaxID=3081663 RepID=UPI00294946A7|nr:RDD family protein [Flavobacterium sp. DG1-102-2]MDV6168106.1 RDD family protein [Flavobacterium sp. DG1-102-2]